MEKEETFLVICHAPDVREWQIYKCHIHLSPDSLMSVRVSCFVINHTDTDTSGFVSLYAEHCGNCITGASDA